MEEEVIISVVENIAGQDVLPLIDVLKGKRNVSEFTIAEELKEEINTIRNKLYRLYDYNLVEFTRKKDKKKGWYIYYWTFVPSRLPRIMTEMKRKSLQKLKDKLGKEQESHFFVCKNECMRLTFEKAMDHEFKCLECGELMNQEDNAKRIARLNEEIKQLENEIANEPDYSHMVDESIEFISDEQEAEELAAKKEVKKAERKAKEDAKKELKAAELKIKEANKKVEKNIIVKSNKKELKVVKNSKKEENKKTINKNKAKQVVKKTTKRKK